MLDEQTKLHPLPLMAASFTPGQSLKYIDTITDEQTKTIALCEHYYYTSEGEKCVELAQSLLTNDRFDIKISAALMFGFGSICAGNPAVAKEQFMLFKQEYERKIIAGISRSNEEKVYAAFLNNLSSVLLHLVNNPFVEMDLKALLGGIRLIAFYVLAHNHYLKGEYGQAVGVCETALALTDKFYPIGEIYLHLILCIANMNLHNGDKATSHFLTAWEIAKPDGFIEPFSEHHGLLQGMIEIHLRKSEPEAYERIIAQVYVFAKAWRQVHNPQTGGQIADGLTTTEFTVAMLASKDWSNEKIAEHLSVTVSTVKAHIYSIYKKLHIKSRKELHRFLLK